MSNKTEVSEQIRLKSYIKDVFYENMADVVYLHSSRLVRLLLNNRTDLEKLMETFGVDSTDLPDNPVDIDEDGILCENLRANMVDYLFKQLDWTLDEETYSYLPPNYTPPDGYRPNVLLTLWQEPDAVDNQYKNLEPCN